MKTKAWVQIASLVLFGAIPLRGVAADSDRPDPNVFGRPPTGTIEGLVTFHGAVPRSDIADDSGNHRALLRVDPRTGGVQYIVAFLALGMPAPATGERPGPSTNAGRPVVVDQRDHAFEPHLIAIRSGQIVKFTNSDNANHNVRTISLVPANQFNVFTGAGGEYEHQFAAPADQRPVRLACDIHPWMTGWIYVFDHPYHAVSDADGKYRITRIPRGEHRLVLKQPDVNYSEERTIRISPGETIRIKNEIEREGLKIR